MAAAAIAAATTGGSGEGGGGEGGGEGGGGEGGGGEGGGGNLRHTSPSKLGFELSMTKPVALQIVNQLLPDP